MRFGVLVPQFTDRWEDVVGVARRIEGCGYDEVWVCDHLQGVPDRSLPVLEGWATLSVLAGACKRLALGTLVLNAGFRPPEILAHAVRTLAPLVHGRLILGLGAGWNVAEHRALGFSFPSLPERMGRLEEAVDAVRRAAEGVPVLVGGASSAVMNLAARKADLWNPPADRLDDLPDLIPRLGRSLEETGRRCEIVVRSGVVIAATSAEADCRVARRRSPLALAGLGELGLVGSGERIAERVRRLGALGVRRLVLRFAPGDLRGDALERFGEEVVARFR